MSVFLAVNPDGADAQAQAVLAYLRVADLPDAILTVARWHNCREQGYVVSMMGPQYQRPQWNIAFFEHRNSDQICAVVFEQNTTNPPTVETFPEDHPYAASKWNTSHTVGHGKAVDMATWIAAELTRLAASYATPSPNNPHDRHTRG